MPLIVTPREMQQRGELYHQLGSMMAAGLPLISALKTLHRSPPSRAFREPIARITALLEEGEFFGDALGRLGPWAPQFDVALLRAGERSGRLDACFRLLAGYYAERAQLTREAISALIYPICVLHFSILLGPFPTLFQTGDLGAYLGQTLGTLVPLYLGVILLLYICQGRHGEFWRSLVERIAHRIPLLGKARQSLALSRHAAALDALLNAGVNVIEAWEMAAAASGSPALRRAVARWRVPIENGDTPGELVSRTAEFPELFANLYHTGEVSGQIDDTLRRLHAHYQDEGSRKLKAFAQWFPRLIYMGIAFLVGWRVISFYQGYFKGISDVMGGF